MENTSTFTQVPPVDIHPVLDDIAFTLFEISGAAQIFIFCQRGVSENFDPVSTYGSLSLSEKRTFWAASLNRDTSALLRTLNARPEPFWINPLEGDRQLDDPFLCALQSKTVWVYPLMNQELLAGVILFGWAGESIHLSGHQSRLITAVTRSFELALENARLNEMISLKFQQTRSFQDITREILRKTDLQDVFPLIGIGAMRLLDAVGCTIYLYNAQNKPEKVYQTGRESGLSPAQNSLSESDFDLLKTKKPLLISFPSSELEYPQSGTLLVLPLPGEKSNLGWMEIFQKERPILPEDVEIAALFADQASVAIEHTRLYQRVQTAAVVEERARLARELHDSISQSLYAIDLAGGAAQKQINSGHLQAARNSLELVRSTSHTAIGEMRLLIYELRPPMLEQYGFCGAVERRLHSVEERSGLTVELDLPPACLLPEHAEEHLYRIVQEALNNVLKHAQASQVSLRLTRNSESLTLVIADDGQGFEVQPAENGGFGLKTMRERAALIQGTLVINSVPQHGTTVSVRIPYGNDTHSSGR